jgi:hypothetical protein
MEIAPIDDDERLFVSSAIDDWPRIRDLGIQVVIDLESPVDEGLPTRAAEFIYVYFPIRDGALPDVAALAALGRMGADLHRAGWRLLVHCGMGLNRSALLAGVILHALGWDGPDAVARLQQRRQGALFNEEFERYVRGLRQRDS